MAKIVPNIWCNGTAEEAAAFYASVFPRTRGAVIARYPDEGLPDFQREMAGKPLMAEVVIDGYQLMLINAGPEFSPNESITFLLNFDPDRDPDAAGTLDAVWAGLVDGGEVVRELGEYPFSPRHGWVRDRYGVTWQLLLNNPDGETRPFVMPSLLFCGPAQNRARAAITKYTGLFPDSGIGMVVDYSTTTGAVRPDSVMWGDFRLAGQWFTAMDSIEPQDFSFTCGVSFQVNCDGQEEIDRLWAALSAVPEAEQCGWCADEFGVSWQVVPGDLGERMVTPEAYRAMLGMKKIVLADLPLP
ncbi:MULTISPECIES: VOC family protein [unclassified Gordonia (in: high G+C Gram-positive bacteria)]|uniref:VOC family protein n=1 Tax=unclassified Gordonia (in: high G+C Gram-positive bacteria) TaxID=2657482 RepID=UPI001FFF7130|nr:MULTISPECIES: VOC family protein [unclassified Gordonia (in: high G+C Gram-positive bacteria)]UQE73717.1 VOC family protein [Gordonia sp. PP30]